MKAPWYVRLHEWWEWGHRKFPEPKEGQRWQSLYTGSVIEVVETGLTDYGTLYINYCLVDKHGVCNFVPNTLYWKQWNQKLRDQRRVLC